MDDKDTLREQPLPWRRRNRAQRDADLALSIVWSLEEPQRVGEVALLQPGVSHVLGRGPGSSADSSQRLEFGQLRSEFSDTGPLKGTTISRNQVALKANGDTIAVERIGQCSMAINGSPCDQGQIAEGDTLLLTNQLLLLCTHCPPIASTDARLHPFGRADEQGIVGESAAAWRLRADIAFAGAADAHVLIFGASGTGKELAARAIHGLSSRAQRPLVARSAATFPASLVDAELFGNVRDFPNPGMADRPGLIGEAENSTLFLDEIGEMPSELQAHLLRVLDDGEYHRLGETKQRKSNFRLVAATNRDPSQLKHDLLARFRLRIEVPSLDERRQDIALLAHHLLRTAAPDEPRLRRYFDGSRLRLDPVLMDHLARRRYDLNVRDLNTALWSAIAGSDGELIEMTSRLDESWVDKAPRQEAPTAEAVLAALEEYAGNITKAADALGLANRYALYRLIKTYGIEASVRTSVSEPSREQIVEALSDHDQNVTRAADALGLKSRYALYRLMKKHGIER